MLHTRPEFRALIKRRFEVTDITRCLCLRAHSHNPWVLANLRLQFEHFQPLPPTLVVDQGSEPALAEKIRKLTEAHGGRYIYDDYQGLYSPSLAHNLAAARVETDLIFFTDPDFLAAGNLFSRMIEVINQAAIGTRLDLMINLPSIHLNKKYTKIFRNIGDAAGRTALLERIRLDAFFDSRRFAYFVSPYSNVFLCRRDAFQLSGGYDETFSGHGSEDFEFLLRYAVIMNQFPRPVLAGSDLYRPTQPDFYRSHDYAGFRSLLALMSITAEVNGWATFHLQHPIQQQSDWRRLGDRNRFIFKNRVEPYLRDRRELLERDWLPRGRRLLVRAETEPQTDLLLPLRLAGYKLCPGWPATSGPPSGLTSDYDALALILANPDPGPEIFEPARPELETIVIRPGRGPNVWHYGLERPVEEPPAEPLTPAELAAARALAETPAAAEFPESLEPTNQWAELIFRRYSLMAEGRLQQFCFKGRRLLMADRAPRLTGRTYALGRYGVMTENQLREFETLGQLKNYEPEFKRWAALARPLLKGEKRLAGLFLRGRQRKWLKYNRNRASFFSASRSHPLRVYYRLWRWLFRV